MKSSGVRPRRGLGPGPWWLSTLLPVLLGTTLSHSALACSCPVPSTTPKQDVNKALAEGHPIFEGIVTEVVETEITENDQTRSFEEASFTVLRSWQGLESDDVSFTTNTETSCCICGIQVTEGERFLVFAEPNQDGSFGLNWCSLTRRSDQSESFTFRSLLNILSIGVEPPLFDDSFEKPAED